ncbi:Coenzyme Q-binding protein coq10a, mitochondrial [Podila epigama]|nr:Coenzyme Q-binding protein coq10a, mitochondrial [Podila epigama]
MQTVKHYRDRKLLKYSQQEFFDLVANVDDYHKFLPWCTHSKMSEPLAETRQVHDADVLMKGTSSSRYQEDDDLGIRGEVTVRHGELGIGFNSFHERYVSKVTCQEPWIVKAVSYDSKLFKELRTIWKFTPNVPKSTTLNASLDQQIQERQLLIKSNKAEQEEEEKEQEKQAKDHQDRIDNKGTPVPTRSTLSEIAETLSTSGQQPPSSSPPPHRHFFTAVAVFGESVLPYPTSNYATTTPIDSQPIQKPAPPVAPVTHASSLPTSSSVTAAKIPSTSTTTTEASARTASPSNLGVMKPSDYPSCWIDFEIQFEFASPVHASMSSMFFDQVSKEMLAAFVRRAEVLYGAR